MPRRYWYIIIIYLATQLSGIVGAPILLAFGMGQTDAIAVWSIISFTIATVWMLLLLKPELQEKSDRSKSGVIILWGIAGFFLALFAQNIAGMIEMYLFNSSPESENTEMLTNIASQSPIFILLPVIFAPITEEIIFRKIIFGSIYKRTNFLLAVFISSLAFAAFHFDFTHLLVYFAAGSVFAFLYVRTKSIITPMITHMILNSLVMVAQLYREDLENYMEQMETILLGGFF
ncbi:CPBP family intramembrane glutamic endopeptidase [Salimicrobium jeotgali]|uniref:CPBP family intramembrane glutamic endopeptidase n=1 Tax=Salimicrobium jeotgali TaxID=1230341 RepID=UPI000C83C730|nr:type II CAAX endopeptidase family protein [Salimicrobium jeotgali]